MSGLIEKAIPTDKKARDYLRNTMNYTDLSISAFYARELFKKELIKDKHNFQCPTPGCTAPITCHALEVKSINSPSPSFRNHVRNENRHIDSCDKDLLSLEKIGVGTNFSNQNLENENSGEYVVKFKNGRFSSYNKPTTQQNSYVDNSLNKSSNSANTNHNNKKSQASKRKINTNIQTLQQLVDIYNEDKEKLVYSEETKRHIPIKFMFKVIFKNRMYEEISENDLSNIYYGKIEIQNTKYADFLKLQFECFKFIDNVKYYPSFRIDRNYLETKYNNIYKAYKNGETEFYVYTTFPFILQRSNSNGQLYLNFASFEKGEEIKCNSEEFDNNFLIR
ncbi:hypothetical protein [Staphylococcus pasteuri]|uniref:hypothetical protein n=1 Tax=Staphylococcus pasteuri TaxID=45972 RepID=UPI002DBAB557|nr:hypothetical protein [Staphylococcus pasteuri]MEB7435268.1 hypothetical protein [Staphylococcus pasteuri]